jgi:hypothetical protein
MHKPVWRPKKYTRAQWGQEASDTNAIPGTFAQTVARPRPRQSPALARQDPHTAPMLPPGIWFRGG